MLAPYGAAKAGLMAVTHSLAVELGQYGIIVNAVIPGATMTAERIAMMQASAAKAPFEAAPTDAPLTLAKQREMLQKGGLAEHLSDMPLGRTGYPDDLAKASSSWLPTWPATSAERPCSSTAPKPCAELPINALSGFVESSA
jgi:NAD(P)-dependent dehydrogenase (short-subunit alcohol dehydrogenase family)